jgi:hypothetical protein
MSCSRVLWVVTGAFALLLAGAGGIRGADDPARDDADDGSFGMTAPIACKEIIGYESYVPLPEPSLTRDEKLLVYLKPRNYKSERQGEKFHAHLTQDAQIRKRGDKAVLWSKPKIVDYSVKTDQPPRQIFFQNTISLKDLKPGEYALDVLLRDEVGQSAPATRTLFFKIVLAATKGPQSTEPARSVNRAGPN